MENRQRVFPLKPISIESRILFSMLYQAKHKLKVAKWMTPEDLVEANPMIFDRMQVAIKRDYGISTTRDKHWRAAEILLEGMKRDGEF